jgi:uncharacterized membrane protein YccC
MVELTDSGPAPPDDIGRKRETPMNSTPDPKETEPRDTPIAGADERLAHAHEEIRRADEQLALVSEQLAKMERDDARPLPARPGPQAPPTPSSPTQSSPAPSPTTQSPPAQSPSAQSPPERPARRGAVGMLLVACFVVAALALSAYGSGAKLVVARWAPQLVSTPSLPPESPTLAAQSAPSIVQVAAAETAPPPATPLQTTPPQATPPQATSLAQAQTAPQDAAPAAPAAPPDQTQLLQTIARDLANLERTIEQLKASQQQMASDNSKAIGELKATQEEMKRSLAKVSEQTPPKASPPPAQPVPALRRPERTYQPPQARARPRYYPREWMYDDW